jgi:hypothetical protein
MPKEHIFINSHNGVGERLMPKKIFFLFHHGENMLVDKMMMMSTLH